MKTRWHGTYLILLHAALERTSEQAVADVVGNACGDPDDSAHSNFSGRWVPMHLTMHYVVIAAVPSAV
jgi:hypothetical protein